MKPVTPPVQAPASAPPPAANQDPLEADDAGKAFGALLQAAQPEAPPPKPAQQGHARTAQAEGDPAGGDSSDHQTAAAATPAVVPLPMAAAGTAPAPVDRPAPPAAGTAAPDACAPAPGRPGVIAQPGSSETLAPSTAAGGTLAAAPAVTHEPLAGAARADTPPADRLSPDDGSAHVPGGPPPSARSATPDQPSAGGAANPQPAPAPPTAAGDQTPARPAVVHEKAAVQASHPAEPVAPAPEKRRGARRVTAAEPGPRPAPAPPTHLSRAHGETLARPDEGRTDSARADQTAAPPQPAAGERVGAQPNAPAAPAPRSGVRLQELAAAMRAMIRMATREGTATARITLHPEELGGVRVRLRYNQDGLSATLTADSEAAVAALTQAGGDLRRTLEAQGVVVHSLDVNLAGDGQTQGSGRDQAQALAQAMGAADGDDAGGEPETAIEPTLLPEPGAQVDVLA